MHSFKHASKKRLPFQFDFVMQQPHSYPAPCSY